MVFRHRDVRSGGRTILFSDRENKIGAAFWQVRGSAWVPSGEIFNGFREGVFRERASFMLKAWSEWWAGEEFQRQSTGNQRQNTKRDVSHGLCESIRGAKGLWFSRLSPEDKVLRTTV